MSRRQVLVLDFSCAFAGALLYFLLYDFIVNVVQLPMNLINIQIAANFTYGIYGISLYLSRSHQVHFYRFLMIMNFAYACFCLAATILLFLKSLYWGSLLLFSEAVVIAILARYEKIVLKDDPT